MNRRRLFSLVLMLITLSMQAQLPTIFAHRGCWLDNEVPENSIAAVEMARRFGYPAIECDVHYTKDSVMVLMHDNWDMRRCIRRKADYSEVTEKIALKDITFEELRENYVLPSSNPDLRTPVPTLEELLVACRDNGVIPLLHSDVEESYAMATRMFGDKWIAFCSSAEMLKKARSMSNCLVLLDISAYPTINDVFDILKEIGGRCGVSTMDYYRLTPEFCRKLRKAGYEVQASIYPTPFDLFGTRSGVSIQLSDYLYLPTLAGKPVRVETVNNLRLKGGSQWSHTGPYSVHYGAQTVEITFRGIIIVKLADGRRYILQREKMGTDNLGVRFINKQSDIQITTGDDTIIKSLKIADYEF